MTSCGACGTTLAITTLFSDDERMIMKACKCGFINSEGTKFCGECGKKIEMGDIFNEI